MACVSVGFASCPSGTVHGRRLPNVAGVSHKPCAACEGAQFGIGRGGSLFDGERKDEDTGPAIGDKVAPGRTGKARLAYRGARSERQIHTLVGFQREKETDAACQNMEFRISDAAKANPI